VSGNISSLIRNTKDVAGAKILLNSNQKKIYIDKLQNYQYLISKEIHSTQKFSTNSIERKNLSIRTHLKRLNRGTICFSKNLLILSSVLKIFIF
jgi:IS1 family transposase